MGILDRQRLWAFAKAYAICFITLVGLYVVIDAFTNSDEFSEVSETTGELFRNMGWYYLIKMSMFYDRLCGVITMMAAIFTVTWMQKNNELLAMLAAGISTRRVIRPVLFAAIAVSSVAVINQEYIMPRFATELQKSPDDDGVSLVLVSSRTDSNEVWISGSGTGAGMADRATKTINAFSATIPVSVAGEILEIQAKQARYVPPDASLPIAGGWLLHGVKLHSKPTSDAYQSVLIKLDDLDGFPLPNGSTVPLSGGIYFLKSDLSFESVTRKRSWYNFGATVDLIRALRESSNRTEWTEIEVFLHARLLRPLSSLALLGLSLPLVLGGQNKNMFINLGLSLATSGVFYAVTFMTSYFATNNFLSPELGAWVPLIGFGTLAVARWDSIRT